MGGLGQCPTQPGSNCGNGSGHGVACTSGVAGLRETIVEEWLASLFISLMLSVDVKGLLCDSHSMIIQMPIFFKATRRRSPLNCK